MARHGFRCRVGLVLTIFGVLASHGSGAVVIDTLSGWDYNLNSYGEGSSLTYGQTITAPAVDNILDSFTFKLLQGGGNPTTIRFFVMEWAGNTVTGPVLFQTGPVTLSNSEFYQDYTVTTGGLPLTSGNQYGLFFTAFLDLNGQNDASFAAAHLNDDPYAPGRFVYNDGAASFAALANPAGWSTIFLGPGDLAFRAEFSSVPEASSATIFLLIGLSSTALLKNIGSFVTSLAKSAQP